ncbi:hypothetical protein HHI36_011459 [Cryptolaemus montrouzieri]|uniref:Uncharacterized protein n=1 Tax=Cryptolaemus montrouzieri TaxID=559131 RepID=A0ABD2MLT9_9CUCU
MISKYKEFDYSQQKRGKVTFREFISGLATSTFSLEKMTPNYGALALPTTKAYPPGKVLINDKKIEDVKKLMSYTVGYESFHNKILYWPTDRSAAAVALVDSVERLNNLT